MKKFQMTKTTEIINQLDPKMFYHGVKLETIIFSGIFSMALIQFERKIRKIRKRWEKKGFGEFYIDASDDNELEVYGKIWLTEEEKSDSIIYREPLVSYFNGNFPASPKCWPLAIPKYLKRLFPSQFNRAIKEYDLVMESVARRKK